MSTRLVFVGFPPQRLVANATARIATIGPNMVWKPRRLIFPIRLDALTLVGFKIGGREQFGAPITAGVYRAIVEQFGTPGFTYAPARAPLEFIFANHTDSIMLVQGGLTGDAEEMHINASKAAFE